MPKAARRKRSPTPRPGQVWQDNDPRCMGERRVAVVELHPSYALVRNVLTGRCTKTSRERFDDRRSGFSYVSKR
jgi:hypothetical protein